MRRRVPAEQLSLDEATLRLVAAALPAVKTPVVRWRHVVRVMSPPDTSPVSVRSFRAVASALADFADRDGGRCCPGVRTLAELVGVSERTVQYALRALEKRRLIRVLPARHPIYGTAQIELVCPPVEKAVDAAGDSRRRGAGNDSRGCSPLHPRSVLEDRKDRSAGQDLGTIAAEIAKSPFVAAALEHARAEGMTDAEFWIRTAAER